MGDFAGSGRRTPHQPHHLIAALQQILAQRTHGELDGARGGQLHEVGALVVLQRPWFDEPEFFGRHLGTLGEVDAVVAVPEAAELKDVILA